MKMPGKVVEVLLKQRRLPLYLLEKTECYTTNECQPAQSPFTLSLCYKNTYSNLNSLRQIYLCGLAK